MTGIISDPNPIIPGDIFKEPSVPPFSGESLELIPKEVATPAPTMLNPVPAMDSITPNPKDQLEGFIFGLVSPGVQEKISVLEGANKRKSDSSPENSDLSRKDKKVLKEEERRQKKLERKLVLGRKTP